MVSDFRFEELGPRAFEQLAVALAMSAFGPRVEAYGSGRDGGREATIRGHIDLDQRDGGSWDGYTIVQAKHREHLTSTGDNLRWLKRQIREELDAWAHPASTRGELPDNLLFVTNVRLSPVPASGIDELNRFIQAELSRSRLSAHADILRSNRGRSSRAADRVLDQLGLNDSLKSLGLREIKVWHRDILNGRLSIDQSVRKAFPALWVTGDTHEIAQCVIMPSGISREMLADSLKEHARFALRHERWVRFEEAGATARSSIDQVIVDLPAFIGAHRAQTVLAQCLAQGDQVLRTSTWNSDRARHLVLTGAPGNGKSTLTKYLTQVYRCEFAKHETDEPTVAQLIRDTAESLDRLGLPAPISRRWPMRIDLADAVAEFAKSPHVDLRRLLCLQLTAHASAQVTGQTLDKFVASWPSILIFDGLDEVTSPQMRSIVIDEIIGLVERLDRMDADVMIVVTTRPTGYTERIAPKHFAQIDLGYFDPDEAAAYGRHVTCQRFCDDVQQRDRVLARFNAAVTKEATQRLLKTPLQVLILTVILASAGSLPTNRYLLFWRYYEAVFRREADKPTAFQQFLNDHQADILELHQQVGLVLQMECEDSDDLRARLPRERLRNLALRQMLNVGWDASEAETLATRILDVATQRLVLLVADQDHSVSFDIRSLQELMAGRSLASGAEEDIRSDLAAVAASAHWRNTWLFAAGQLFADGSYRSQLVMDVVVACDEVGGRPSWLYPAAPELAAYILEDGLAAANPRATRQLVDIALRCLQGPMPEEPGALARGLLAAASTQKTQLVQVRNALKGAFAGSPSQRANAAAIADFGDFGSRLPGQPPNTERFVAMWKVDPPERGKKVRVKRLLQESLDELSVLAPAEVVDTIIASLDDCTEMTLILTADGDYWPLKNSKTVASHLLKRVAEQDDTAELLDLCLGHLDPSMWAARSMVARSVWGLCAREPVSGRLSSSHRNTYNSSRESVAGWSP